MLTMTRVSHDTVERLIDEALKTNPQLPILYLDDEEWAAAKQRRTEARASLACEGMDLTVEDEVLFDIFEQRRYAHDTCRQLIVEYLQLTAQRTVTEPVT